MAMDWARIEIILFEEKDINFMRNSFELFTFYVILFTRNTKEAVHFSFTVLSNS